MGYLLTDHLHTIPRLSSSSICNAQVSRGWPSSTRRLLSFLTTTFDRVDLYLGDHLAEFAESWSVLGQRASRRLLSLSELYLCLFHSPNRANCHTITFYRLLLRFTLPEFAFSMTSDLKGEILQLDSL